MFQGALCVSNQDMGVILADLCIELASATISTANTHYCREGELLDCCLLTLHTRATNASLKAPFFFPSAFNPSQKYIFLLRSDVGFEVVSTTHEGSL